MALHGPIQVNGYEVGRWIARRTVTATDGVNTYECGVAWTPEDQQRVFGAGQTPHPERVEFTLTHDYRDGAVALAAKVLARAARLRADPARLAQIAHEEGIAEALNGTEPDHPDDEETTTA